MLDNICIKSAFLSLILMFCSFVLFMTSFTFASGVLMIAAIVTGFVAVLTFVLNDVITLLR